MIRSLATATLSAVLFAAGCNKSTTSSPSSPASGPASTEASSAAPASAGGSINQSDQDAIRAAVRQHLAGNRSINMTAMDMNITQISINGDQAQASVEFRLKQGGTTMEMSYALMRHAGGWLVTKSQPGGGQFAHPPMDKDHATSASGVAPAVPADGAPPMPDVHNFFKNNPGLESAKH